MNTKKTLFSSALLLASLGVLLGGGTTVIGKSNECKTSEQAIVDLTDKNFQEVISNAKLPVVIDFYADWCPPCKQIKPVFEELACEYSDTYLFAKVNIDQAPETAQKYGVKSIPTFIVIKNEKVYGTFVGGIQKKGFKQEVEDCLAGKAPKKQSPQLPQMPPEMVAMQAVASGNRDQLSEILASGDIDVNKVIKMPMPFGKNAGKELQFTLLSMAMSSNNKDIVKVLLDAGASPEVKFESIDGSMVTAIESLEKSIEELIATKNEMKALLDGYKKEKTK